MKTNTFTFKRLSRVYNEKIISLTDADEAPEEMVEAEEYTFDVEVKLRRYKQRLQRSSIGITDAADLSSDASGSGSQQASGPHPPNSQRRVNTNSFNKVIHYNGNRSGIPSNRQSIAIST
ncbi:hypothetical protein DPMN_054292 [Dreissena polymorpha]|uniref:Uncharacterized protein n=1 Tax=Dreissena polymorpha TaxID=45954 RepID=A0A9D4HSY5_DREPO|nr:hypothetical protein DPMN_054292 [Dreissena polymorpha]